MIHKARVWSFAKRWLPHAAAAVATLAAGVALGGRLSEAEPYPPVFHDLRVNHPRDYSGLIAPDDPAVAELARQLGSPEAAYGFVRDRIAFEPMRASGSPAETLQVGRASCLGKTALLVSLYRALGVPASGVRVVIGQVPYGGGTTEHAWVDLEYGDRCLQQDPTDLLGVHEFGSFPEQQFVDAFVSRELFCFNDEGFAAVSQLNRMRR